ncbi:2Fe-2S iron-sulfur cluster binding domain-containing protein [Paraburkholderia caffeinilytica]|uniref:2Fe-2S iron-sulfur cluster binding domain-containing protein n=1 Tax=Paraburkholderia caffeinilytica TaxID=1761016 RepID=UPI003DA0268D
MTFQIQLTTRDDYQLSFDCAPDQDRIAAAAAVNITLPSQCRKGSCGACHATVTCGDYEMSGHHADALLQGRPGAILMCRTTPRSDLHIALPCDQKKVLFQAMPRRLTTIVALETIAHNTVRLELRLDPEGGEAVEFELGQVMEIEIPGSDERRPYSLANTSNWDGRLEFLIRLQPDGRFSTFLRERAGLGAELVVRGPMGTFGVREDSLRPRWFVAGGTGVAPMLSMLRCMAELQEMQDARLFFGVNLENELFLRDDLIDLQAQLPQLQVDLCVWRQESGWKGARGTPADALRDALVGLEWQPDVYVCGPPALIRAAERVAAEAGLPSGRFESERFDAAEGAW